MHKQDFEKYAETKPFNSKTNPVWERLFTRFLQGRPEGAQNLKALDYGCGDGKHLPRFEEHGLRRDNIFGNEVSELRVQRCRENGWNNVHYVDLHKPLPFANGQFDFINLMEVIEHIPSGETDFYIEEIRRVIQEDGIFFVSTPNYPVKRLNDFYNVFRNGMWARLKDDPTHVTFYTPKSLQRRLQKFFPHVAVICYKEGVFYPRIKHPAFMHKIIAIASPTPIPAALLAGETSAL